MATPCLSLASASSANAALGLLPCHRSRSAAPQGLLPRGGLLIAVSVRRQEARKRGALQDRRRRHRISFIKSFGCSGGGGRAYQEAFESAPDRTAAAAQPRELVVSAAHPLLPILRVAPGRSSAMPSRPSAAVPLSSGPLPWSPCLSQATSEDTLAPRDTKSEAPDLASR
eukprot:scaffold876_cov243-Pinguiococcus_pyrenoidosus.AAC.10